MMNRIFIYLFILTIGIVSFSAGGPPEYKRIPLKSFISGVQPMTGIVFWSNNTTYNHSDAISMEYSYMKYSDVVKERGEYDWTIVEDLLDAIASRKHQAILRSVNGIRAGESLKTLQPGEIKIYLVNTGGKNPVLSIECDQLVNGQKIEFEADIK